MKITNQQKLFDVFYMFAAILDTPIGMGNWDCELGAYLLFYKNKKEDIELVLNDKTDFDFKDEYQLQAYNLLNLLNKVCNSNPKKKDDKIDVYHYITKIAFHITKFLQTEPDFFDYVESYKTSTDFKVLS